MYDFFTPAHDDLTVTSELLHLMVTFRWRPLLDSNFTKEISQWIHHSANNNSPNIIFIGFCLAYHFTFILDGIFLLI